MSRDDPDFNPDRPPAASGPAGFPWRAIPATLAIVLGGSLLAVAEIGLFAELWHAPDPAAFFRTRRCLWFPLFNLAGGFWITSGVYFVRRLWWRAVLYLVVAYLSGVAGAYLIGRP